MCFVISFFHIFFSFSLSQDSGSGTPVTMRIDPKGFYLCWVDQNNEMDLLDIATIRDVRTGQFAKKPRVSCLHYIIRHYQIQFFVCFFFGGGVSALNCNYDCI